MSAEHTKSPEEIIQSWIMEATPQELIQNKFVKQLVEDLKKTKGLRQSPGCEQIIREALKPWEVEND